MSHRQSYILSCLDQDLTLQVVSNRVDQLLSESAKTTESLESTFHLVIPITDNCEMDWPENQCHLQVHHSGRIGILKIIY